MTVYYNPSFPQNLNHWLLEKSEIINLQMHYADSKNTFNVFALLTQRRVKKCAEQCLPWFLWHRCHFGTCESLGSSPLKNVPGILWPFVHLNLLYLFMLPQKG